MPSPEVESRLQQAREGQASYHPNESVAKKLHDKNLIMLVGPVAVGKSFIMNALVASDPDFHRVPVLTTRDARPDDEPGMFRALLHDDEHVNRILDQIEAGDLVQYAIHPTSGRIYATTAEDYPGAFNLLATLSGAVEQLRRLPFKKTHVVGVVANPTAWKHRLETRYPAAGNEKTKRLIEARVSLEWLLAQNDLTWTDNSADGTAAAQTILNSVKYNKQTGAGPTEHARQMLYTVEELL